MTRKPRAKGQCWDCSEPAAPGRARCEAHFERSRAINERYRAKHAAALVGLCRRRRVHGNGAVVEGDMREMYRTHRLRWAATKARAVYDTEPPAEWELLFWQNLSIRLGRTLAATYKTLACRWGWAAKTL